MNFYNEHDPHAAAWLRELIREGHIPPGTVDERDIQQLTEADLVGFTQVHLFAGIGGWPYALRLAGWPDDQPVWTGSCPCQPFSDAGEQKGEADERHLWPEMRRLLAIFRPSIVFGEQVASSLGKKWLSRVRADLEELGYAVGAADLCAACAGEEGEGWFVRGDRLTRERIVLSAPHIRPRLYWVADASGNGRGTRSGERGNKEGAGIGRDQSRAGRKTGRVANANRDGFRAGSRFGNGVDATERREPINHIEQDGALGRLAHSDGGEPRHGDVQPGWQHGQQQANGGTGGLEHAASDRRQQRRTESGKRSAFSGCGDGAIGLGDALGTGLEGHAGDGDDEYEPGRFAAEPCRSIATTSPTRFWSDFDAIPCSDGKARPVEPGTFPLAHGISGRVGALRGYGNAIVPPLAKAFIEAFLAARDDLQPQRPEQVVDLLAPKVGRAGQVIVDLRAGHLASDFDGETVGRPSSGGDGADDGAADVGGAHSNPCLSTGLDPSIDGVLDAIPEGALSFEVGIVAAVGIEAARPVESPAVPVGVNVVVEFGEAGDGGGNATAGDVGLNLDLDPLRPLCGEFVKGGIGPISLGVHASHHLPSFGQKQFDTSNGGRVVHAHTVSDISDSARGILSEKRGEVYSPPLPPPATQPETEEK